MSFSFRRAKKHEDVIVDRVTGAFNRRQLDADISAGVDTSGHATATLMIDVDQFASYDGKRGTASGDQVLERVAWVIMATVRTTDVVYRHDSSTFCVLLPSTDDTDAVAVADRIRANVAKMPLLAEYGVSISIGVATCDTGDVKGAVDRAVQALDEAVRTGQPRIVDALRSGPGHAGSTPTADGGAPATPSSAAPAPAAPAPASSAPAPSVNPMTVPSTSPTATATAAPEPGPAPSPVAARSSLLAPPSLPDRDVGTPLVPPVAAPADALGPLPPPPAPPTSPTSA